MAAWHAPHACYFGARDVDGRPFSVRYSGFVLCGDEARSALGRTMASINLAGGTPRSVRAAVEHVGEAHDAADFLRREAERGTPLAGEGRSPAARWAHRLALEMALHDEQERRALGGELTLLEAAWREAEEIADIADRLTLEARTAAVRPETA